MDPTAKEGEATDQTRIFEYRPARSPTLLPNEHVRAMVELLRPAGPDLARRWLSALALVPEHEREQVVRAVERRIVEIYIPDGARESDDDVARLVGECWREARESHRSMRKVQGRARRASGDASADGETRS